MPVITRSRARANPLPDRPMSTEFHASSSSASARARPPNVRFARSAATQLEETASPNITIHSPPSGGRAKRATTRRGRRRENSPPTDESRPTPPGDRKRSATGAKKTKDTIVVKSESDIEAEPEKTEEKKCCICLEEPSSQDISTINGCAHIFCFGCIEKWSERENSCPLCKNRFTKIERVYKSPTKKRRKGAKNTKRVNHRDQRSDYITGNPLQGLFGELTRLLCPL